MTARPRGSLPGMRLCLSTPPASSHRRASAQGQCVSPSRVHRREGGMPAVWGWVVGRQRGGGQLHGRVAHAAEWRWAPFCCARFGCTGLSSSSSAMAGVPGDWACRCRLRVSARPSVAAWAPEGTCVTEAHSALRLTRAGCAALRVPLLTCLPAGVAPAHAARAGWEAACLCTMLCEPGGSWMWQCLCVARVCASGLPRTRRAVAFALREPWACTSAHAHAASKHVMVSRWA